jgi:hypothetical protein
MRQGRPQSLEYSAGIKTGNGLVTVTFCLLWGCMQQPEPVQTGSVTIDEAPIREVEIEDGDLPLPETEVEDNDPLLLSHASYRS